MSILDALQGETLNESDHALSFRASQQRSTELEKRIAEHPTDFRILTGDRPTGPAHIGHYFGSFRNRVRLQQLGVELFVIIADYQVLTDRDVAERLTEYVEGLVCDYLAVGIDPATATIFTHSAIPALNQLLLPFLSLISVSELSRNPTVKEEISISRQAAVSGLMFTYPAHQAADILSCKANLVPVGKDQLPHQEVTRTIARRFNERYAADKPLFSLPEALLSEAPNLLGVDGKKMSKSRGNAIALSATEDQTAQLVKRTKTDTIREITYEPESRPEVSSLVLLAALCQDRQPQQVAAEIGSGGSATLKTVVIEAVNELLRPIRARRAEIAKDRSFIKTVLRDGNERMNVIAKQTLTEVREAMGMSY